MTSLYHDIIYGPVHSRRLGLSLGVNLLPTESKLCSFDCIYCEFGWNADHTGRRCAHTSRPPCGRWPEPGLHPM